MAFAVRDLPPVIGSKHSQIQFTMLRSWLLALFSLVHLAYAVNVYLHPQTARVAADLLPERASFALARHLNLERFEPLPLDSSSVFREDQVFFGKGQSSALVIALDSADVDGEMLRPSFFRPKG
jgi:hypothetical protein